VFIQDADDQLLFLHPGETILDLVLVGDEQRTAARQGDADLDAGETAPPAEHNPPDRPGHAAVLEYKRRNGRESAGF
jgi:hypothetical protein